MVLLLFFIDIQNLFSNSTLSSLDNILVFFLDVVLSKTLSETKLNYRPSKRDSRISLSCSCPYSIGPSKKKIKEAVLPKPSPLAPPTPHTPFTLPAVRGKKNSSRGTFEPLNHNKVAGGSVKTGRLRSAGSLIWAATVCSGTCLVVWCQSHGDELKETNMMKLWGSGKLEGFLLFFFCFWSTRILHTPA